MNSQCELFLFFMNKKNQCAWEWCNKYKIYVSTKNAIRVVMWNAVINYMTGPMF